MDQQQFNPRPEAISEQISQSMPKEFQEAFARVVKAGMKVIFSEETHEDIIQLLSKSEGDIGEMLGGQIANLMAMLYQKSNNTIPGEVIVPAGIYLLAQASEFLEKVTDEEISPEIISVAMQTMIDSLMRGFGVDPQQFSQISEQALSQYQGAE
ncbi:MAG: hypothetical protein CTY14_02180 [Methylotenera sp.]|nr:MAG: hypothetical protein CTY14_02180 [Methylotenera sp.]